MLFVVVVVVVVVVVAVVVEESSNSSWSLFQKDAELLGKRVSDGDLWTQLTRLTRDSTIQYERSPVESINQPLGNTMNQHS